MIDKWEEWIKSYKLPDYVHLYKMNGKLIFTLSGYHIVATNYVYIADLKDILVHGLRLDNFQSEEAVHRAMANVILSIQIDLKHPKSYANFYFNGKNQILAP